MYQRNYEGIVLLDQLGGIHLEAQGEDERAEIVAEYRANLQEMRDAVRYLEAIEDRRIARLQEHQPHPEATWGEVFEERGGRWVPKG